MDPELKALIESDEFRRYCKGLHARPFNPFDVLQVADLEIRHSNVLAWLLTPDETHGIGSRFLRALVEHLTRRHSAPSLRGLTGFDDKEQRRGQERGQSRRLVRRRHRRLQGRKGAAHHREQGRAVPIRGRTAGGRNNRKALGKKYQSRYDDFPGALLTTSNAPEGSHESATMRGIMHLSWVDVGEIIRSLLRDRGEFYGRPRPSLRGAIPRRHRRED